MDTELQENTWVYPAGEAPELEGGDVIWFDPRDLLPWALHSFGTRYAFRIQIGCIVMDILRVRVYNTLRLKPR
jgi:hypothetical protein